MNKQYKTAYAVFEWDTDKATSNLQKHGISFEQATEAFTDGQALIIYDISHSLHEDRYILLGMLGVEILVYFVFTEQKSIRIISARRASKKERMLYANR